MSDNPLLGKKIAVLVESQYVAGEIKIYQERFAQYGATVDLMSRLWGQPKLTFVSEVEEAGVTPETLDVTIDFEHVNLEDYAAVIMAANYPSVRLRSFDPPAGQAITPEMVRSAPAVQFFRRAMRNRNITKGAPCHALWLLTPTPELLAGRKVICNPVVLADVVNAGGVYTAAAPGTPIEQQVVVDDDLVTNPSWHATEALVDAIRDRIVALDRAKAEAYSAATAAVAAPSQSPGPAGAANSPRPRRILIVLSEWGYWGEELIGPVEIFDQAGYRIDFCTPTGRRPNAITASLDSDFIDPALQRPVVSPEMAAKARAFDDPSTPQGQRLEHPVNLAAWFPERPYWAIPEFVRALEAYNRQIDEAARGIEKYDTMLIVGGSGPIVDLANNQRLHDLILSFYRAGKPIAAECYGVTCLAFARDYNLRQCIIRGKHVTGHCLEYDYKDGTGFMLRRNQAMDFDMGPPPYPLEYILRDATGPEGGYHGNFGHATSAIVDYPFITGRSTPDAYLTGELVVQVLDGDPPLRRWGW